MAKVRNLRWFLNPTCIFRTHWISEPPLEIYVRNTYDYFEGNKFKTLHIATISISDIKKRGKGSFSQFLRYAIQQAQSRGFELIIYVGKRLILCDRA